MTTERRTIPLSPIFWLLIGVALLLRLWGIWNVTTTDEYNEVFEALRVGSGNLNFERWAKRCYLYILAVEYGIYYFIGSVSGAFASPIDFAQKIVRNMEPLFIMGRITSALCGTLTVAWLYAAGRRFFSPLAGIAAAVLLAFTVFHIDLSQQAKVDALLGLLVTGSLYFMLRIAAGNPSGVDFVWCGLLTGLAIQTKTSAAVLWAPFLVVLIYTGRESGLAPVMRRTFLMYLPGYLLGLVLGNPPVLFAPGRYLLSLMSVGAVYTEAINETAGEIGFLAYPAFFYRAMGPGISVLSVLALSFAVLRPNRFRLILIAFIVPFYIAIGASRFMIAPYYMIPAFPFLYLLTGDMLAALRDRLRGDFDRSGYRLGAAAVLGGIVILAFPVATVARHELSLAGPNTRHVAKEWIEENIPSGSKILMDSGKSINSAAPLIAENRATLERTLERARANVAEGKIVHGMVDRASLVFYELLLKTVPEKAYDITSTMFGLQVERIDDYLASGFDYFIISENMKRARTTDFFRGKMPEVARFYESLDRDPRLVRIRSFEPGPNQRGDTFHVYRLTRPAGTPPETQNLNL